MDTPERILLFHAGAIGDLVLACPAIAALRARFASARIEGVGYPERLSMLRACGLLDDAHSIDRHGFSDLFVEGEPLSAETAAFLAGAPLVVSWVSDLDGNFARRVRSAGARRVVVGDPFPRSGSRTHAADHYLDVLHDLGVHFHGEATPSLTFPEAAVARVAENARLARRGRDALVGMLPGSGAERKNWPRERFAELARRAACRMNAAVVVFLGPAELERGQRDFWEAQDVILLAERPLVEVAGWLSCLDVFVGCDSGLTHLAAALDCPVVALFGPTDPTIWGPRGRDVRVVRDVRTSSLEAIDVEAVWPAVRRCLTRAR